MMRHSILFAAFATLAACGKIAAPEQDPLGSFEVNAHGVYVQVTQEDGSTVRKPLDVVTACARKYGTAPLADGGVDTNQDNVPAAVRGTPACRYVIPQGTVEIDLDVKARPTVGDVTPPVNQSISFRVVPGDLSGGYPERTVKMSGGGASKTLRAGHLYGEVRVWAEDAPPQDVFDEEGALVVPPLEPEHRSYATGLSRALWFEDPTIQAVQVPDGLDNRSSPFVGQFISIGKSPEAGGPLVQTCPTDPENNGAASLLVVTGADPGGFFVTDVTACRLPELQEDSEGQKVRTPEPNGFYPGRFASMYIYNYSYPEGLNPGDALWSVSGSLQEFTSTTQMTFPAWTVAEHVRERPQKEWNYYLDRVPVVDINLRICGADDDDVTYITDSMCGHNRRNLKMESLESGLVRIQNVRFPERFVSCDFNGDATIPFFCEGPTGVTDDLGRDPWSWNDCDFEAPTACDNDTSEACERQCNVDCTVGLGEHAGVRCAERTTYEGFGQFVVELPGPGSAEAGLDTSLPKRVLKLPVTATATSTTSLIGANARFDFQRFDPGFEVQVWCDAPVRIAFGDGARLATATDPELAANTLLRHRTVPGETHASVIANGEVVAGTSCELSVNMRTKINLITKDSIPDLEPDCEENDPDAEKAEQCRLTRAASYDIVGHLRHLQPGRPRWSITPRDADDVCCHPGAGMTECPKPLKVCSN